MASAMPQDRWKCPEAISHSIADRDGRCMYCGRKISSALSAPDPGMYSTSELTEAYNSHYDPDHGALTWAQIRAKYSMGQNP